jgi:prevent-host-death family protein
MPRKPGVRETVSLYEAKTQLSRLVERAAAGDEIVIAKSGRPRARLVALQDTRERRVSGRGKGQWKVGKDFDAPLPDEVIRGFEGGR